MGVAAGRSVAALQIPETAGANLRLGKVDACGKGDGRDIDLASALADAHRAADEPAGVVGRGMVGAPEGPAALLAPQRGPHDLEAREARQPRLLGEQQLVGARRRRTLAVAGQRLELAGSTVAIWGLSFKPKTDDIREAPALSIIKRLTDAGATVCAYDPEAVPNARAVLRDNPRVEFADNLYDAAKEAEALALVTEWGVFRSPDFDRVRSLMKRPVIFDGRNQYDPKKMRDMGFEYFCIGRPNA